MGKKMYNNGVITKMFEEGQAPEGWVLGIVPRSKEAIERSNRKRKETNLKIYGTEAPLQSKAVQEKAKQTCLEHYGVENPSLAREVQEERTRTFQERYGADNPFKVMEFREKAKQTNLEIYGVENPFQSEEIKEKIRQTNLENLGVEYPTQSQEVRDKVKRSFEDHYGVDNPMRSDVVKEQSRATSLERYGTEHPMQSQEIQDKSRTTLMEHYGVDNPMQSDEIKQRIRETNIKRYGVPYNFQSDEVKERISKTCQEKYGVNWACMRPEARAYSSDSGPNREFASLLDSYHISYEREFHIGNFSYDFRVGNTLIEIDPYATHNSIWDPFGGEGVSSDYHFNKSHLAEEHGYHCIHIFDWDDENKIIKLLLPRERIYARDCEVRKSISDTASFLMEYHIQGSCRGQDICLGLYYGTLLVSLMTFGKPRYNKNYQYELLRYCSSMNVIGGPARLFKTFIRNYNPESIISYCDRSKFSGDTYSKLGFHLKSSGEPSKHWYNPKNHKHFTDNLVRQRGVDQLLGTNYGKGISNEELLITHDFLPVFDCGQDVYVWQKG